MDEDVFLKNRQERDIARAAKQNAEESDDAVARKAFHTRSTALGAQISKLVGESKIDEAHKSWKELQQLIQDTSRTIKLTPHEIKTANASLNEQLAAIDALRTSVKPVKRFAFSSRASSSNTTTAGGSSATTAAAEADKKSPPPEATLSSGVVNSTAQQDDSSSSSGHAAAAIPAGGILYKDRSHEVLMIPPGRAVFVRSCTGCTIHVLPIEGSLFLSDCTNCVVYGACHQLRVKSCQHMKFYVATMSTPVIESCDGIRFGSYTAWRGLAASDTTGFFDVKEVDGRKVAPHADWLTAVGRFSHADQQLRESYKKVDDFHWLRQQQSPNWSVEPEGDFAMSDVEFSDPSKPNER